VALVKTLGLDMHKAIPDESLSIEQGVVKAFSGSTHAECQTDLITAAIKRGVDIHRSRPRPTARRIASG